MLQKCQSILTCVSKTLARKEHKSFWNTGHMQSKNLWEALLLILVSFTRPEPIQVSTRSCAGTVYQNYSTDWNVHFFKTFSFLDTDGAKRSSEQIKEGTECRSAAYAVSSACRATNKQVLETLTRKREEHMGGELSIYLVNCLDYSYSLHSIHER